MRSAGWLVVPLVLSCAAGCGGGGEQAGNAAAARDAHADSVELALTQLSLATFDTISWPSDSLALERGSVVWTFSCRRCHGDYGMGDGGFVQAGDTIRPPSLRDDDWRFAEDREGMRQLIFTGTADGMPHWGLVGLKPRDVDAVTRYIIEVLRR